MAKKSSIGLVVFLAILMVAAISAGIWLTSLFSAEWKVNEIIAEMKAKGRPTSVQDLKSKSKPDARNAAVIYEGIFKQLGSGMDIDDPIFHHFMSQRKTDPSLWPEAHEAVGRYQQLIPLIEEAVSKDRCSFVHTWADDPDQEFMYTKHLRFLNRMLGAMSILDSRNGRIDESMHDIELGFQLSESLNQDPWIMAQLSRLSMIAQSGARLRDVANFESIDETDIQRFYNMLSRIDLQPGIEKAFDNEVAVGITTYNSFGAELAPKGGYPIAEFMHIPHSDDLYKDELYYLKYMQICIDAIHSPYYRLKGKRVSMPKPPKSLIVLSDTMISLVEGIWWKRDMGTAEVSGSRILLALMAYRNRYGSYPASLDQLRSKIRWVIPEDPFAGKDFIYKTKGKGFLLYSLGPNLKDDSGVPHKRLSKSQRLMDYTSTPFDIVWEMKD